MWFNVINLRVFVGKILDSSFIFYLAVSELSNSKEQCYNVIFDSIIPLPFSACLPVSKLYHRNRDEMFTDQILKMLIEDKCLITAISDMGNQFCQQICFSLSYLHRTLKNLLYTLQNFSSTSKISNIFVNIFFSLPISYLFSSQSHSIGNSFVLHLEWYIFVKV